ncbi:MAG: UDP-N-acetylglucosamine 2-epimerase (non-hydrolyzing) [Ardenticatenaceae bacterium]|nr:UDP-N-acetylglucosamine 2-epimerase (non-hydrolyzing) [Ardenticatenaceae bacterium]
MLKIVHVVGARPNFMKIAPIMAAMSERPLQFQQLLVHTGQHYDANMSRIFFQELGLPQPDVYLGIGSGSHAEQTAKVMLAFEPILLTHQPDWVVVVGDVNSTVACALTAAKLGIGVAHVEAGLRSFDWTMPEEINRVLTDRLSDVLFTTEPSANENLQREGIAVERVHLVGNVMIDTLVRLLPQAEARWSLLQAELALADYVLVTLHRPFNVDDPATLSQIILALNEIAQTMPVVFPAHPRTQKRIADGDDLPPLAEQVRLLPPQGYLDFLALTRHARLVLTDSGGIQEETTFLGVPCVTVRPNTERPITIEQGTNELVASTQAAVVMSVMARLNGRTPAATRPPTFWDGAAAQRIVGVLADGRFPPTSEAKK